MSDLLAVPESRAFPLRRLLQPLLGARHVVLHTHVHADGDGGRLAGGPGRVAGGPRGSCYHREPHAVP